MALELELLDEPTAAPAPAVKKPTLELEPLDDAPAPQAPATKPVSMSAPADTQDLVLGTPKLPGPIMTLAQPPGAEIKPTAQWERDMAERPFMDAPPVQSFEGADVIPNRSGGTLVDALIGPTGGMMSAGEGLADKESRIAGAQRDLDTARARAIETRRIEDEVIAAEINPTTKGQLEMLRRQGMTDADNADREVVRLTDALRKAGLAPASAQGDVRSAIETVGSTLVNQGVDTAAGIARAATSPVALIEAMTGGAPVMGKEIDKTFGALKQNLQGFTPDAGRQGDIAGMIAQGGASTIAFATGGLALAKGLGLSAAYTTTLLGSAPAAEQAWQEASARGLVDGMDTEGRKWLSFVVGAGIGASEAIPVSALFSRLERMGGTALTQRLGAIVAQAGEEGLQEFLQTVAQNIAKEQILGIKPEDSPFVASIIGATVGGGMAAGGFAAGAARRSFGADTGGAPVLPPIQIDPAQEVAPAAPLAPDAILGDAMQGQARPLTLEPLDADPAATVAQAQRTVTLEPLDETPAAPAPAPGVNPTNAKTPDEAVAQGTASVLTPNGYSQITPPAVPPAGAVPGQDPTAPVPTTTVPVAKPGADTAFLRGFADDKQMRDPDAAISKLEPGFSGKLAAMVRDMPDDVRAGFKIASGWRSDEQQASLNPKYGIKAAPGKSRHNGETGSAIDVSEQDGGKALAWIRANASKYGLELPHADDPNHLQEAGARGAGGAAAGADKPTGIWARVSGGESSGNYNVLQGGRTANLTGMTIAEVNAMQKAGWEGMRSTAVGRWQIVQGTLAMAVRGLKLDPATTKFDEATQDRIATWLMDEKVGLRKFRAGEMSQNDFLVRLRNEWETLKGESDETLMSLVNSGAMGRGVAGAAGAVPAGAAAADDGDAIDAALLAPQPEAPAAPGYTAPAAQDFASAPRAAGPSQTNTISTNLSDLPQLETKPIVVDLMSVLSSDQPGYDQLLQPRDRAARKGSDDQIRQIAGNLDPAQLMPGPYPDRGAPIVNERGMVESGNGRVMAIRQAYQRALPGAAAYKAALAARGYDVSAMAMPVLVQQRMTPLTPQQIQSFVQGANKPAALTMSASEQAKADGGAITTEMLAGLTNRTNVAANPDFVRAFMQRMTPEERASLIDKDGNVSQAGQTRMRNAVFAAAYGNSDVLARVAEATDDNTRGLSAALMAAAPEFAKLKQMIADGVVPARFDLTADIVDAINRISQMREKGQKLDSYLAQLDAFDQMAPGTRAFMEMFYNKSGSRQLSKERIIDALRWYAQEAMKVQEGGFDMGLPKIEPQQLTATATEKARNNDGNSEGGPDLFAAEGAGGGRPGGAGANEGQGGPEVRRQGSGGVGNGGSEGSVSSGRPAGGSGQSEGRDLAGRRDGGAAGQDGRPDDAGRGQDPQRAATDGARPEALTADDAYDKATGQLVEGFLSPVNGSKNGPVEIRDYQGVGPVEFAKAVSAEADARYDEWAERAAFRNGASGAQWSVAMPINVKYADVKGAYWAGVAYGRDGVAESAADSEDGMMLDTDGAGDRRPRGGLSQTFTEASFTSRRSIYEQAFTDAGIDPNEATILPPEKQIEILTRLYSQRFGIKVVLAQRMVTRDTVGGGKKQESRPEADQRETIDQLLDGYRNIQFMMRALQMPAHAVSLERTESGRSLTMSMEASGRGYLGAYNPGTRTVHLPGRTNSFAHEWMHALDHFLMDEAGAEGSALLSRVVRKAGNADMEPASVAEAFVNVVYRTMFNMESVELRRDALENANFREGSKAAAEALRQLKAINEGNTQLKIPQSKFRQNSAKLGGDPAYWASAPELLARAFEAYVAHKVDITNPEATQEFITKGEFNYLRNGDRRFLLTFPKNRERAEIFRAFDQLFDMMRQESMFGPQRALTPSNTDVFSTARFNEYRDAPAEGTIPGKIVRAVRGSISRDIAVIKGSVTKLVPPEVGFDSRGWVDRAKDTVAPVAFTISGEMHMIASRYAGTAAEAPMREIADMFATRPGSGLLQQQTYDEAVKARTKNVLSIVANILAANNLTARTPDQSEKLRALMTSQVTAAGQPADLVSGAAELARLMQEELYYNKQAGIDVRHVASQGYLPRAYLVDKIDTNRAAFIKDAARVYGIVYDADVNERGGVNADEIMLVIRDRISPENRTPEIVQGYTDILKKQRQIRAIEAKIEAGDKDAAAGAKEIKALEAEIQQIAQDITAAVRKAFSEEAARDWQRNISLGSPTDYDTKGPTSKYTKERKLPAEADGIMKDWLASDPIESIVGYLQASSRRAEYVKRAGKDSATLEGLLSRAEEAGAGAIEIRRMRTLVETLAGRDSGGLPRDISKLANKVYAVGTLALLPRAVIASITEPMATMIRTGDIEATISAWAALIRQTVDTGNRAELAEIANAIGLTTNVMYETIVTDRLVSEIQDKNLERRLSNMFRTTGLTSLTNAQRRSLLPMFNNVYLPKLLSDAVGDDARKAGAAKRELAELGIAEADIADMKKWVGSRSTMPRGPELRTRPGMMWADAANRMIDQIIQDPTKTDKPQLASNPFVRFTYGIMSFNYSFQRKVLQRTYQKVKTEWQAGNRQGAVGIAALNGAAGAASLYTATLLVTMLRAALFDGDRWDEEEKKGTLGKWLAMLAFDRTGFVGAWSPILNAITGIKYDRDLSAIFAGAQVGFFLTGAQRMLQPFFGRNSERTNTTEHRAVKALYQTFAAPALVYAMTSAPGGALAAAVIMGGSSSTAGGMFADAVLGKSDAQIRKDKKAAGNGTLPRPPGLTRN